MSLSPLSSTHSTSPPTSPVSSYGPDSNSENLGLTISPEHIRTPNLHETALQRLGFGMIAKIGRDLLWNLGSLFILTQNNSSIWVPFTVDRVLNNPKNPLVGIALEWPCMVTVQGTLTPPELREGSSYTWDRSLFYFCDEHQRWETLDEDTPLQYEPIENGGTIKIIDDPTSATPSIHSFSYLASKETTVATPPLREQLHASGFKQIGENIYLFTEGDPSIHHKLLIAIIEKEYPPHGNPTEKLALFYPETAEGALILGGLKNKKDDFSSLHLDDLSQPGTLSPTLQLKLNKKSKWVCLKPLMIPQITPHVSMQHPLLDENSPKQVQQPSSTSSEPILFNGPLPTASALISPFPPYKMEGHQFVIGGSNPIELFLCSLNETSKLGLHSIATHERSMRTPLKPDFPNASWLKQDEHLIARLGTDNTVLLLVYQLSHQQIGTLLEYFLKIHELGYHHITYGSYHFEFQTKSLAGEYPSPFAEQNMVFKEEVTITRTSPTHPEERTISLRLCRLSPHLIRAWGFYGGESSRWRIDLATVVDLFKLKNAPGKALMQSIGIAPDVTSYPPLICETVVQDGINHLKIGKQG